MLKGKKVVLGVTAGIAAYKAAEFVRLLVKEEADVHVAMTQNAQKFIAPLTFQTLSGNPVITDPFALLEDAEIGHIALADLAELVVILPATANLIGKIANGIADDFLSTMVMATRAPVLFVPSMNVNMWENKALQRNIETLLERGYHLLEPGEGELACHWYGKGRLPELTEVIEKMEDLFSPKDLKGEQILITGGPTQEPIDPVRFITNRSSGKMGYAVAEAARDAGANVVIVSGPVNVPTPHGVQRIDVETAEQMMNAVQAEISDTDIFIAAAAVSDYRMREVAEHKIKKTSDELSLQLSRTPDILATVAAGSPRPFVVGFAAETQNVERNALGKLEGKKLDMIAANQVGEGLAFDCDDNALTLYWPGGKRELERAPKCRLASELVAVIAERFAGSRSR